MSHLHSNILKLLQDKKSVKISAAKLRKLKDGLKKLHEEATGSVQESTGYFAVPLQHQQQETSTLTNGPVPHFLESVTRYILENYATQEGIIRKNGNERRVMGLKDLMEKNGAKIPPGEYSVHDVTCVLKRWLRCLPEPVVPRVLHDVFTKCVELDSHHHSTQALLLSCLLLPTFHLNTLKHVAVFLQEIAKNDLRNKMTSENLAKVLAPSLIPRVVKTETDPELVKKFSKLSTTAVQVLIDNAPMIGVLPPEYEPLRDGKIKEILEVDCLSETEGQLERSNHCKKLFTFLKSKGNGSQQRSSVLRTPQQPSKRLASVKNAPQSCPPKMTKAALNNQIVKVTAGSRQQTPPPHKRNTIVRSIVSSKTTNFDSGFVALDPLLGDSPKGGSKKPSSSSFHSPPLQNEMGSSISPRGGRATRSASRRLKMQLADQLLETKPGDLERGASEAAVAGESHLETEDGENRKVKNTRRLSRNNPSVRSLPAQSSHVSILERQQRQRASVRRSATVRAAMKFSCAPKELRQSFNAKAATSNASVRRSPSTRGVVARKASLRDSVGARCSPRKPPRTTRLTDAGIKVRMQQTKAVTQDEEPIAFGAPQDTMEIAPAGPDADIPPQKSVAATEHADEVAAIIGQLSVAQCNSPEAPVRLRSSSGQRSRLSVGTRLEKRSCRLGSPTLESEEHSKEFIRGDQSQGDDEGDGEAEFVLRTVTHDNSDMYRSCDHLEEDTQNKGSGDRRRPLKGGSQSAPTSSSSLIAERVKNAKWRVGQRSEGQIEVGSVLDNSGTCVDSEDESRDDFVDGVEFMRRLSEQQMENQHDQRETRASFMAGMLDTPVRTAATGPEQSPNSRRESVIAIRVSRAGFVRRNVRQIENTFATPIGKGVRTRQQSNSMAPPSSTRLRLAATPAAFPATPEGLPERLCRNEPSRRPLTPANAKKILGARRSNETKVVTSPMEI